MVLPCKCGKTQRMDKGLGVTPVSPQLDHCLQASKWSLEGDFGAAGKANWGGGAML